MNGGESPSEIALRAATDEITFRDSCAKIPKQELKHWKKWLEKAADDGDERAGVSLALGLLAEMRNPDLPLEDQQALRSRAMDLLENQIASGRCQSIELNLLASFSTDPIKRYIYGNLLIDLANVARGQMPADRQQAEQAAVARHRRTLEAIVPENQLPQANATLAYIADNYCEL